jgi:serine/threonine-protein kinase RsbW
VKFLAAVTLAADMQNLKTFVATAADAASSLNLSPNEVSRVELVTEEVITNIIRYAYPDAKGNAALCCLLDDTGRFVIEVSDSGIAFNMTSVPEPDLASDLIYRCIGRLGLHLIRKFTDDIKYRRQDNTNILTLTMSKVAAL